MPFLNSPMRIGSADGLKKTNVGSKWRITTLRRMTMQNQEFSFQNCLPYQQKHRAWKKKLFESLTKWKQIHESTQMYHQLDSIKTFKFQQDEQMIPQSFETYPSWSLKRFPLRRRPKLSPSGWTWRVSAAIHGSWRHVTHQQVFRCGRGHREVCTWTQHYNSKTRGTKARKTNLMQNRWASAPMYWRFTCIGTGKNEWLLPTIIFTSISWTNLPAEGVCTVTGTTRKIIAYTNNNMMHYAAMQVVFLLKNIYTSSVLISLNFLSNINIKYTWNFKLQRKIGNIFGRLCLVKKCWSHCFDRLKATCFDASSSGPCGLWALPLWKQLLRGVMIRDPW